MDPIKITLTVNRTREQELNCSRELNKLYGYKDGNVPLTDKINKEHLDAASAIFRGRMIKANIIAVTNDGNIVLEFTDDNSQSFYKTI